MNKFPFVEGSLGSHDLMGDMHRLLNRNSFPTDRVNSPPSFYDLSIHREFSSSHISNFFSNCGLCTIISALLGRVRVVTIVNSEMIPQVSEFILKEINKLFIPPGVWYAWETGVESTIISELRVQVDELMNDEREVRSHTHFNEPPYNLGIKWGK